MADITKTVALKAFQWSRPENPNPRLAAPISATATTIQVTAPPLDTAGAVITEDFIMTVKSGGYTEAMLVDGSSTSVDGKTLTVTRGLYLSGLDKTTGNAALAQAHPADSPVACSVDSILIEQLISFVRGSLASGTNEIKVGAQATADIKVTFDNGAANLPYIVSKAAGMFYAEDGATEAPMGGAGALTAGDGIDITGGAVSVDLTDTGVFVVTTAGAGSAGLGTVLDGSGLIPQANVTVLKLSLIHI